MQIIEIVNKKDKVIGTKSKEYAFENSLIRRTSKIYIVNDNKEIFIQQRSINSRICPMCWDSSAAGHVNKGETYIKAAKRELQEEIGLVNIKLKKITKVYLELFHNGKINKQFTTIYIGKYNNGDIKLQKEEVNDGKWIKINDLIKLVNDNPNLFTPIFIEIWNKTNIKNILANY